MMISSGSIPCRSMLVVPRFACPSWRWMMFSAKQRPDRQLDACGQPRAELFPAPRVHADLAPTAALAVADEQRPAARVEVVLGERERLLDAEPGAPQDDDRRSHAPAVAVIGRVAHDRHDLLHRRWVRRVTHSFVVRRTPGVVAGQRRR
jgi:hypothetical protein